jgi:hypothetical protein
MPYCRHSHRPPASVRRLIHTNKTSRFVMLQCSISAVFSMREMLYTCVPLLLRPCGLNTACPNASCLRNCPIAGIALGRLEIEREVTACAAAKNIGARSAGQDIVAGTAAQYVVAALAAQHVAAAKSK